MTPLSVSCALFYIRHRYFHSGTETVQDDDPLFSSTLTVFLKLFKFSENTSLAKWNVSVLVISVHLCVSSMWIWNVGTIHLSNHSIVFLGLHELIILQFEVWFFFCGWWVIYASLQRGHSSTALFAYDLLLVNIPCAKSNAFPNNRSKVKKRSVHLVLCQTWILFHKCVFYCSVTLPEKSVELKDAWCK